MFVLCEKWIIFEQEFRTDNLLQNVCSLKLG